MIRVAVLDRHPAVRAGLYAILGAQPGLAPAGSAADRDELWSLLYRTRPDVVLVEHEPGVRDGLGVCLRIRSQVLGPRVVLCAADPGTELVVPATFARADALIDRAGDVRELLHAVRIVAAGGRMVPAITPRLQAQAAARLGPRDRAIFAMRLAATSPADIAQTVGLSRRELAGRVHAIVAALAAPDTPDHPHDGVAPPLAAPATGDAA